METKRKQTILILAAVAVILGMSFYSLWQKNTVTETTSLKPPSAVSPQKTTETPVIYISGAVNKPGVYKLPPQTRVLDAINAAGGLAPGADAAKVNLAQPVKDGLQIHVPLSGEKTQTSSNAKLSGIININTADKTALEKLPGVGPSIAEKIIEYRSSAGSFKDVSDIKKVPGIGDTRFNQIKDKITI